MSVITLTVTGTIAPVIINGSFSTNYGIDYGGYFGAPGASLAGQEFTVTWTGYDCNCFGRDVSFNPIIDAVITINGHSYDFGPGIKDSNDFTHQVQQVQGPSGSFDLTTWYAGFGNALGTAGHDGVFYIKPCCDTRVDTQAFLTLSVPAPVMGAELPGLLAMLIFGFGVFWKNRPA